MSFFIEKLMYWRAGNWIKSDHGSKATLRIHCDQLIISNGDRILENLNMNGKIKGIYKGDVLILIVSASGAEIRKLKFLVTKDMNQCVEVLGKHFPVVSYGSSLNGNVFASKYRSLEEVMKCALKTMEEKSDCSLQLPDNYASFVKLCLLDPSFPQFVQETKTILDKL